MVPSASSRTLFWSLFYSIPRGWIPLIAKIDCRKPPSKHMMCGPAAVLNQIVSVVRERSPWLYFPALCGPDPFNWEHSFLSCMILLPLTRSHAQLIRKDRQKCAAPLRDEQSYTFMFRFWSQILWWKQPSIKRVPLCQALAAGRTTGPNHRITCFLQGILIAPFSRVAATSLRIFLAARHPLGNGRTTIPLGRTNSCSRRRSGRRKTKTTSLSKSLHVNYAAS